MRRVIRIRTLALAALTASAVVAAGAAEAAQPKSGTYAGPTTQPESMPFEGAIKLKVVQENGAYEVDTVKARVKLDCQDDPPSKERFTVDIPSGEGTVSAAGRFKYENNTSPITGFTSDTSGFLIKGRFTSRNKAKGTFGLSDAKTGCFIGGVKWKAKLR